MSNLATVLLLTVSLASEVMLLEVDRGPEELVVRFELLAEMPESVRSTVSSGARIEVAATETLLAALRRNGVDAPYSCQQGFCGTCRVRVRSGAVQHRDSLLTDSEREQGMMLTCVSRAAAGGHLTIDL